MRVNLLASLAAGLLLTVGSAAEAMQKPALPAPVVVPYVPPGAKTRPVKLVRAVMGMKEGDVWLYVGSNLGCSTFGGDEYKWSGSGSDLSTDRLGTVLDEELGKAGFRAGGNDSLFETSAASDDLQVGVKLNSIQAYVCTRLIQANTATLLIDADWQVFDPLKREVIYKLHTATGVERPIKDYDDLPFILFEALRENARTLIADAGFRGVVMTASAVPTPKEQERTAILLAVAKPGASRPIGDVSASVVALFAGNSMGSGFLVSDDGYILTNHHVVGSAAKVRIRWSDGFETTGDVIRSDKRRDVALVKTEPRGRPALALVRGTPAVGSSVYAVGTPLDESMLNTVTRGIVSANRFMDGFAFIQSDVGVNSGNSGGPLLDEKGRVIGITVIKMFPGEGQQNLNLFIPIGDALDFLALKTSG